MPTFKSLKQLERYMQKQTEEAVKSPMVASLFAQAMQDSVFTEVYNYYEPSKYKRRYEEDGLGDIYNMQFTSHKKDGNTIVSNFENLATGVDSMGGKYISETIENGIGENWTSEGKWSEPRPFAQATANKINNSEYNRYLKQILESEINN